MKGYSRCFFTEAEKEERLLLMCRQYVDEKSTIRKIAEKNNISKSTLHKFINKKLMHINKKLYLKCRKQVEVNIFVRHINGGNATKQKYLNMKK